MLDNCLQLMVIILDQSSDINILAEVLMASDYREYAGLWGVALTLTLSPSSCLSWRPGCEQDFSPMAELFSSTA